MHAIVLKTTTHKVAEFAQISKSVGKLLIVFLLKRLESLAIIFITIKVYALFCGKCLRKSFLFVQLLLITLIMSLQMIDSFPFLSVNYVL